MCYSLRSAVSLRRHVHRTAGDVAFYYVGPVMDKWLDGCIEAGGVAVISLIVLLTLLNFIVERCGH